MVKKICNLLFVAAVFVLLIIPLVFADWTSGGVSESENRNLAKFPQLIVNGKFNNAFTSQFDVWFTDHLGFREEMISFTAARQYELYDRLLENSGYHIGPYGDINYADKDMILDFAHANLRTEEEVAKIGQSYQVVSDWLEAKGIVFYYVQCYDKHSIYPEQFRDDIQQIGDISKTDQVIAYLENETTVKTISLKPPLLEAKANGYEVYSNWGDPCHWSFRGSRVGYWYIMDRINRDFNNKFPVLQEEDYDITIYNAGITLNNVIHEDDYIEKFEIRDCKSRKVENTFFQTEIDMIRHTAWENPSVDNDTRVMLMCDSYIDSFIKGDFAESFAEVGIIWGDYTGLLPYAVGRYQPDIVIYECAERVDRSMAICDLADRILSGEFD